MYPNDPGGRFASNVHRRVLAHLSHPDDDYGWSETALLERMRPDVDTQIDSVDELQEVLASLEEEGYAVRHDVGDGVWQMTEEGFDVVNGSIANEPGPDAAVQGPAQVSIGATSLSSNGNSQKAQPTPTEEEE